MSCEADIDVENDFFVRCGICSIFASTIIQT